ncbi:unnamed protein product [Ectocarpus sp. 8 AP-2014]
MFRPAAQRQYDGSACHLSRHKREIHLIVFLAQSFVSFQLLFSARCAYTPFILTNVSYRALFCTARVEDSHPTRRRCQVSSSRRRFPGKVHYSVYYVKGPERP